MNADDVGKRVYGASDRRIGTVARVHHLSFELQLDDGPAVWLPDDIVFNTGEKSVTLICDADGIPRYLVDAPVTPAPGDRLAR